ncbi:hypothetical protein [Petrimonas sp.]|uniref:hypothetical protein n=1 Tax=Petrimonas sp. TaxID=2023866 RepID=UPI003F517E05
MNKPEDYPYSNAIDFGGGKGLVHIEPCQFSYKLNVFWAQVENLRQSGAGQRNSDNKQYQFWQQHNQPIELSVGLHDIDAAIDYIHENPVKAGFVNKPEDYPYSSAIDFGGGKGLVNIEPC